MGGDWFLEAAQQLFLWSSVVKFADGTMQCFKEFLKHCFKAISHATLDMSSVTESPIVITVFVLYTSLCFTRQAVKPQPQVTPSHQLRIDTLLSRNETHTHIITTTPSDNLKTDILADSPTSVASESDVKSCCGQVSYSDDISDDVIDCLFDDIDYLDKFFEPEPLPLATESHHCSVPVKVNSDQTETDIAPIVVSHDDDDDVIDLSSISSSSGKCDYTTVVF